MIKPRKFVEDIIRIKELEPSRLFKTRLDRNERNHPFSDAFMERLRGKLSGELIQVYPEPEAVYDSFSAFLGVSKEQLLFNSGSDQSIKSVFETYVNPGDKILLHRPGYAMYPVYAGLFGALVDFQDFDSDLKFDYETYIKRINSSFKMAVLENPNGFVGIASPDEILYRFVEKCEREGVIALIDEAYYFFCPITVANLIDSMENLIVVRTFSKAFGIAGLRAGYLLSNEINTKYISKVKPMHELNSMSLMVISEIMKDPSEFYSYTKETSESRDYFKRGFERLGIETSDSAANFIAVRLGRVIPNINLSTIMRDIDILIRRPFRESHLYEWTRIATAPIPVEERVLSIIADLLI